MGVIEDVCDIERIAAAQQAGWLDRYAESVRSDERRRVLREVRALLAAALDSMIDVFEVDIPETSGRDIWFASIGTVSVRAERYEVACREGAALVRQAIEEKLRAALSKLEEAPERRREEE